MRESATLEHHAYDQVQRNGPRLSWSAISTYLTCPLRYYFRYAERREEEFVSSSLILGTAIHAVLRLHYEKVMLAENRPTMVEMMEVVDRIWLEFADRPIRFGTGENRQSVTRLAERMIVAFLEFDSSQRSDDIIGCEVEMTGSIDPDLPEFVARIDLIASSASGIVIRDFKTSRSRWSLDQIDAASGQLLLYDDLAKSSIGIEASRLEYVVITKSKSPAVEVYGVDPDPQRSARLRGTLRSVWRAIRGGHFYPNVSAINCSACPYRSACREWTG